MKAYVRLLHEGTDAWREIAVEPVAHDLYRIDGEEPEDEIWEHGPGTLVRLVERQFEDGKALVAAAPADVDYYAHFLSALAGLIDDAETCGYDPDGLVHLREAREFFDSDHRVQAAARGSGDGQD